MKKPAKPSAQRGGVGVWKTLEMTAERLIAAEAAISSLADRLAVIDAGSDAAATLAEARRIAAARARAVR